MRKIFCTASLFVLSTLALLVCIVAFCIYAPLPDSVVGFVQGSLSSKSAWMIWLACCVPVWVYALAVIWHISSSLFDYLNRKIRGEA